MSDFLPWVESWIRYAGVIVYLLLGLNFYGWWYLRHNEEYDNDSLFFDIVTRTIIPPFVVVMGPFIMVAGCGAVLLQIIEDWWNNRQKQKPS